VPGAFRYANNIYNAGDASLMRTGAQWAKFAADSGAPEGWVQYGLYVEAGLGGLARDPVAARALYAKAANSGNIWGRGQMGGAYLMGIGGPQDISRGIALWEQVVAEGYLAPADMLGFLFRGKLSPLEGKTPLDPVKARRYSLIAAERGDAESQFLVAEDLFWGTGGPEDASGAVRWARASAATVAPAHRIMGLAYAMGKGVAKDEKQSALHFQRGAEAGDAESQWRYAWVLYNADKDALEPPLRLLRLAASQGHSGAIIDLGTAKLWGWFKQPADVLEGVRLLTDVINRQDHADAYYALGRFYAKGPLPYRNRALALDNLQKATDRGHTDSAAVMQALLAQAKP
jgi:hypothetical protein